MFVSRAVLALPVADLADFLAGNMVFKAFRPALLLLPFVCTRLAPRAKPAPWRDQLEAAYAGQTLSPAGLCPHRNAQVLSQPVGADGLLVCPMHGLGFDQAGRQCPVRSRR